MSEDVSRHRTLTNRDRENIKRPSRTDFRRLLYRSSVRHNISVNPDIWREFKPVLATCFSNPLSISVYYIIHISSFHYIISFINHHFIILYQPYIIISLYYISHKSSFHYIISAIYHHFIILYQPYIIISVYYIIHISSFIYFKILYHS